MNAEQVQNPITDPDFAGFEVTEIRTQLKSQRTEFKLETFGTNVFANGELALLLSTDDPELAKTLVLGFRFGVDGEPVGTSVSSVDGLAIQASAGSAVLDALKHFGKNIARAVGFTVTEGEKTAAEQAVIAYVGKDGLQLLEDAVVYVNTYLPGTTGTAARDAAVAKFKADAEAAKLDLSHLAAAAFNFVVEAALQIALNKGTVILATAAAAAIAKV